MSEVYIRELEDGTIQRATFEDNPGKSTPQWRLESEAAPKKVKKPSRKKATK
jgi:hypothetical protein